MTIESQSLASKISGGERGIRTPGTDIIRTTV